MKKLFALAMLVASALMIGCQPQDDTDQQPLDTNTTWAVPAGLDSHG